MAERIAVGIDVGTYQVRVVVAKHDSAEHTFPKIIGTGYAESKGLRHGYIVNIDDVSRSVRIAVQQAEKVAGIKVRDAFLAIGGIGLDEVRSRGETIIARADAEVTDLDIEKAVDTAREHAQTRLVNRRILHTIPLSYTIDGVEVLGRPQGMKGTKLAADVMYITCLEQHVTDMVDAVEAANIAVVDVMAAPLAGSIVSLSPSEKKAGCVLANIGAETVSVVVFDNGIPISVKVFKIGSMDITKDIALGLRISLDEAEQLKLGAITHTTYPKKKLDDILAARLTDIFELIDNHLKKLGRNQLLPAGIILTGGGSGIGPVKDIATESLRLHSKTASLSIAPDAKMRDASWMVAYGLTIWGLTGADGVAGPALKAAASHLGRSIGAFFKQFLP
ncbi:MAG: cell division protein FtsA [Candidatus Pacebacteria bacterium]|jgi:cell division protein FtsA|nr:cell division protein FtsA [Candidatus Paceibacterota bacterium]